MTLSEAPNGPRKDPNLLDGSAEIRAEKEKWNKFHAEYLGDMNDHELSGELLKIRTAAEVHLREIQSLTNDAREGSYEQIAKHFQQLGDLYWEANDVRASIIQDKHLVMSGAEKNESVSDALNARAEETNLPEPVKRQLSPLFQSIGVDPRDAGSKNPMNTFYNRTSDGRLTVNAKNIRSAEKQLAELEPFARSPEQKRLFGDAKKMLSHIGSIDPLAMASQKINTRSTVSGGEILRKVAIIGGALLTVWAVMLKNWKYATVTGIATAWLLYPDLLKGKDHATLKQASFLVEPESQKSVGKYLTAEHEEAIRELYGRMDGVGGDRKGMSQLLARQNISNAQLDQYFGGESTPLREFLTNIPEGERSRVMNTLRHAKSNDAREIVYQAVREQSARPKNAKKPTQLSQPS